MSENYQAKVEEVIGRELTKKELFSVSRFNGCEDISSMLTACDAVAVENVQTVVFVDVHNEKSDNKDYTKMVVIGENGDRYITGSETAMREVRDIMDYMADEEEPFTIQFVSRPSSNYKDRDFITAELL